MRYAIFSDVHANLRAWESVLEDIRAQEVDMLICLGDVVGYGPKPVEVLDSIRAVTSNFVMGNHDAAAIGAMDYSVFNDHARHSTEWTAAALTDEAREFLSSVPIAIEADEILFVHAEVAEPGRFDYIKDVESAEESFAAGEHFVTFVGHTHHPKIFERTRNGRVIERPDADMVLKSSSRYIVNVGSVGEPRTADDLRARYVVYDSAKRKVEFRAVMFDIPAYRRDLDGTELKVTPFFLSIFEQETGMLAQEWLIEHEVAPLANSDWVSASGATGTVQLQEESKPKSVWITRVLPAVAALVVLAVPAIWGALRFMDSRQDESGMNLPQASADQEVGRVAVVEESGAAGGIDFDAPLGPVPPPEPEPEPEMAGSDPSGEAGNLAVMEPKEVPAPPVVRKPAPAPEPAAPPVPQQPKGPVVAWWRMEQASATLEDLENKHPLEELSAGTGINALGPSRLSASGLDNDGALQLGVWSEASPSGEFGLRRDRSFTFEAWVLCDRVKRPVFLAGTRSGEANGQQGWHIDLRPPSGSILRGQMSFFWDSGPKIVQALSEDVTLTDLRPHHVAAVWDHDVAPDVGEMRLYLDGVEVAATKVHHSLIEGGQANPFRIGAEGNPERLAMDEVRFSRIARLPSQFLGAETQMMTKKGNWTDKANWSGGQVPTGRQTAVVAPKVEAVSRNQPPAFIGDLVLRPGATLRIGDLGAGVLPRGPGRLVMETGSRVLVVDGRGREQEFGPILMSGRAEIWGGTSNQGHHSTRIFGGRISGRHQLVLVGVNSNEFRFSAPSTFTGGLLAESRQNQGFQIVAEAARCFGRGGVHVGNYASLILRAEGTIDDAAILELSGPIDTKAKAKVVLYADETVRGLRINGANQKAGTYGSPTSAAQIKMPHFGGSGILTVK